MPQKYGSYTKPTPAIYGADITDITLAISITYVQKCTQVLINNYFKYD